MRGAAGVMARAFHDDPAWTWVVPDPERRREVLPRLFAGGVRLESLRGNIVRSTDGAGVAVWVPPDSPRPTRVQLLRSGISLTSLRLRRDERARLERYLGANFELRSSALPGSCWLLSGVAVEPARQGEGIGSALIDLRIRTEASCGLLTSLPENIAFYERRGFKTVSERADPDGALRMWAMLRQ